MTEEVVQSKQDPIVWTAAEIVELFSKLDGQKQFHVQRSVGATSFQPFLNIQIPYETTHFE